MVRQKIRQLNIMKIISGKYNKKIVATLNSGNYKPTTTKCREAIFSILSSGEFFYTQPIVNAKILDLFSGTGILSFESLSRGAKNATLVDNNFEYLRLIKKFANKIGEKNNINCQLADASNLSKSTNQYNIVFIDPPYHKNLCTKTITSLIQNNWLEINSIIVIEMEKMANISLKNFPNLRLFKEKIYGNTKLLILGYKYT